MTNHGRFVRTAGPRLEVTLALESTAVLHRAINYGEDGRALNLKDFQGLKISSLSISITYWQYPSLTSLFGNDSPHSNRSRPDRILQ